MRMFFTKVVFLLMSLAGMAHAEYPERPINVITPFAPGGTVDIVARLIADPLGRSLGTPIVVENRAGASGMIGSQFVANAKPDGYTLLANSSIHVIVPSLYPKIPYDALNDLRPVSMISSVPLVLVSAPSMPFRSVKEMIAWGKAQPNGVSYGSAGTGSTPHIAGELLGKETGLKVTHIPYKGSGAAMVDVMGGQVPMMFDALTAVMSQIKAGKLIALAIAGQGRSPVLPDVPTFAELGFDNFDLSSWHGFWVPKNTPNSIVDRLAKEMIRISHTPEVERRIQALGAQVVGSNPSEFDAYARSEHKRWGDMVRRLNITVD